MHSLLKIELPNQNAVGIIPKTKHTLLTPVCCQHGCVSLQTLAEISSPPGPPCGQILVEDSSASVADDFCTDFCGNFSMESAKAAQFTVGNADRPLRGQCFIFPHSKARFFRYKQLFCARKWLPKSLLKDFIT